MEGGELVRHEPAVTAAVQPTPMNMIQLAMGQNVPVERLQALWELQLQWEKNEARKAYTAAMNKFKENPPTIRKTKEVSFGAGKAAYKHATLDDASEQIGAALSAVGISHRWNVQQQDAKIKVTCVLTHVLGHSEEVTLEASPDTSGSKNSIQAVGSTVSYLQRYSLFAATGLASKGADDDGRGGIKGMDEKEKAGFLGMVGACETIGQWQKLWDDMSAATTKAADVATHEEFRAAMAPKYKALQAAAKKGGTL